MDINNLIKQIIDVMGTIAMYIGIVLLAWGIIQLVLAMRNEEPENKNRAIMLLVISVVLIGLKAILSGIVDPLLDGNILILLNLKT